MYITLNALPIRLLVLLLFVSCFLSLFFLQFIYKYAFFVGKEQQQHNNNSRRRSEKKNHMFHLFWGPTFISFTTSSETINFWKRVKTPQNWISRSQQSARRLRRSFLRSFLLILFCFFSSRNFVIAHFHGFNSLCCCCCCCCCYTCVRIWSQVP